MASRPDRVIIEDPRAIRALAHPARLAILEALKDGDQLTATDCASVTGLSPSATAYHLKALEKWGIVEPADPRADGRERPWRARGGGIEVRSRETGASPAEMAVLDISLDRTRDLLRSFVADLAHEPAQWQDVLELDNNDLWLTVEEVREFSTAYQQLIERYRPRRNDDRPVNSRRVRISRLVVPRSSGHRR